MPPLESLHTLNRIARWILLGLDQASARNDADGVWAAFDALDIINRAHSTAVFEAPWIPWNGCFVPSMASCPTCGGLAWPALSPN